MLVRVVSEKFLEMMFNYAMLRAADMGSLGFYAPTSRQEFKDGYDANFTGMKSCHEVYLQFKAPKYISSKRQITIEPTTYQHKILKVYPAGSAFYVLPLLTAPADWTKALSEAKSADEILKHFICVDAADLDKEADLLHYTPTENGRNELFFRRSDDLNEAGKKPRNSVHSVMKSRIRRGDSFRKAFKKSEVGWSVTLGDSRSHVVMPDFTETLHEIQEIAKTIDAGAFGTGLHLRTNIELRP
jgi:hypothetical protein